MPYCAVLECKNDSRTKNITNGGISYHRFPKNPFQKEKWIDATGRQNWMPVQSSTICSVHFNENDSVISKKGYRYLSSTALPTEKIVTFFAHTKATCEAHLNSPIKREDDISDESDSNTELCIKKTSSTSDDMNLEIDHDLPGPTGKRDLLVTDIGDIHIVNKETGVNTDMLSESTYSTPRERKLSGRLRWAENMIKNQRLKIKQLQGQKRRLTKKSMNLKHTVKELEEKLAMTNEKLACLQALNVGNC